MMGMIQCYLHNNKTGTIIWILYDHVHLTHVTCSLTFRCFLLEAFQHNIKKFKDGAMVRNNYNELSNVTLVGWVDKALDHSSIKHNIKLGFRVTRKYGKKILMPWMAKFNPKKVKQ